MSELIGIGIVLEFVKTLLFTGRVKDAQPVSGLLIALPECGKTTTVTRSLIEGKCKSAIALTDVTGRGLMDLCKQHPEVTHFILNDLVTVMSHRESVNRYTLSVINAMTEEGIGAVAWPGKLEIHSHGRRAIIACSTPGMIKDKRAWWNRHGLASRMVPFYFDHSDPLTIRIKDAIDADEKQKGRKLTISLHIPEKPVAVTIPQSIGIQVRKISDNRAAKLGDPKGYRRLKQFRALVKAHALARGERSRAVVREADIEWLREVDRFISYSEAVSL